LQNHHWLPGDCPLWMQFRKCLHQHHADDALYENILWNVEVYFVHEEVFNIRSNCLRSWANPLAAHACRHQVWFGVNMWSGIMEVPLHGLLGLLNSLWISSYEDT
jgi:hypothetical protein